MDTVSFSPSSPSEIMADLLAATDIFELQVKFIDGMLVKVNQMLLLAQKRETGRITVLWLPAGGERNLKTPVPVRWAVTKTGRWHTTRLPIKNISKRVSRSVAFQERYQITVDLLNQVQHLINLRHKLIQAGGNFKRQMTLQFNSLQNKAMSGVSAETHAIASARQLLNLNPNFYEALLAVGLDPVNGKVRNVEQEKPQEFTDQDLLDIV